VIWNEPGCQVPLLIGLWRRDETQLLHHADLVIGEPALYNFAILDALNADRAGRNPLTGWGNALKVASTMDGLPRCARGDLVPLGDLVFYSVMSLTESRTEYASPLQH